MKQFLSRQGLAVAAISLALLAGCGKSKQEEQIQQLTAEIQQIDSSKATLETTIDSLSRQKEALVAEAQTSKASATDLATKLRTSNAGIIAARQQNAKLLAELNNWKEKAAQLAKENQALTTQVQALTKRAEEAEARVARAEQRAEEADAKVRQYEALLGKTYYISSLDVTGYKGKEQYKKDKIKPGATSLAFTLSIGRPEGFTGADPALRIDITDPKGQAFTNLPLTVAGSQATATLDIKATKLDLNVGKHNVRVVDTADNTEKFQGSFMVSR